MKLTAHHHLIIISIFCFALTSCSKESSKIEVEPVRMVSEVDLQDRNGIYYEKDQEPPFSGKSLDWWNIEKKKKSSEVNFKDGKYHGLMTLWHENGQKKAIANYRDEKYHGTTTNWYKSGQKKSEANYKDGNVDGEWTYWNKNGENSKEDNDNNRLLTEIQDVSKLNLDPNASSQSPILNRKIESREALGELEAYTKNVVKKALSIKGEYAESLAEVNYEDIIDPHRVKADSNLAESKKMISHAKKALNKLNTDLLNQAKETKKNILSMPHARDKETQASFQRGMVRGLNILKTQYEIELAIINEQEKLLEFLHKKRTSWTIVKGRFIFDNDEDLKVASEYLIKVVKLGLEQEEVTKQSVATTNKNLEKLKTPTTKNSNFEQDFEKHMKLAQQGDARSQCLVALCYAEGRGIPQDAGKAYQWYLKSAEQDFAFAQSNLANCYEFGKGVPKNLKTAFDWKNKAAHLGLASAQNELGYYYENGIGVPQDFKKALGWYLKAAKQGYTHAQINLALYYAKGGGVVKVDLKQAKDWLKKAKLSDREGVLKGRIDKLWKEYNLDNY